MKKVTEKDKKIIVGLLLFVIFGWLIYLTIQVNRVDENFNGYIEFESRQNLQNSNN